MSYVGDLSHHRIIYYATVLKQTLRNSALHMNALGLVYRRSELWSIKALPLIISQQCSEMAL